MEKSIRQYAVLYLILATLLIIPLILAAGTLSNTGGVELSLNKTDNADPANASQNLSYVVLINITGLNQSISNISNLTLTETYPSEVIFLAAQPTPLAGTNNTFILGNFSTNDSIEVNITVLVLNITNGTVINNTANISFQNDSSVFINVTVTENTTILNPPLINTSNLSVIKSDTPDPVNASTNLTYQINVTSTGNTTAFNTTVNEVYPAQVIFLAAQPDPLAGTNSTFILGNLTAGTSILVNITVLVLNITNGTVLNNTVNTTFQNETSHVLSIISIQSTTVLNPPLYNTSNLSVIKSDTPDPVNASMNLTYQINVTSTGNTTAFNTTVNDTYPAEVVFLTAQPTPLAGTNNTFILGNLTPGTEFLINITVSVFDITNGTVINNTVNVTFQNETSRILSIIAAQGTTVISQGVFNSTIINSTVSNSSVNGSIVVNSTVSNSTVTNSNSTSSTVTNSTVSDSNVTFSTSLNSNITNSSVANNSNATNSVITNSTSSNSNVTSTTLTNSVITNSTSNTSNITNSQISSGSQVTNSNITGSNITNATIIDNPGSIINSNITNCVIGNSSDVIDSNKIDCTISDSNVTNSTNFNATLINSTETRSRVILSNLTNVTITGSNITNSRLDNCTITNATVISANLANCAIINDLFPALANISLTKTEDFDPVNASTNLTYQINVTTTGNGTSYNITVNDTYPSQVIFLTAQPTPLAGTNNTFILGNLTNGTSISINVTVLVLNITNGTLINNTVNVTFQNLTSDALSVITTQNTTVLNPPFYNTSNISMNKTDTADPVNASGNLTYTINVTSTGNTTAFNTTVNDTYPSQVIFLTAQPTPLAGTNNTFILGNLTNGTTILINITVLVRNITNGTVLNNTANVTFQNETSHILSIVATQNTTVLNPPAINFSNISVTKTDSPDPLTPTGQLNYTINVTVTGNGSALNLTVNDTYPVQLVFDSAAPTPLAGTNNTFILGNLSSGTSILINITLNVSTAYGLPDGTTFTNTLNVTFQNETSHTLSVTTNATTTISNPGGGITGGSGGGGGGGGATGQSYSMSTNSQSFTLRRNDRVTFTVNNAQHSVQLTNVVPFHATFTIASTPQQAKLAKGEMKEIDVDADGQPDVRITVISITVYDVRVSIDVLNAPCVESWTCEAWTACTNGMQARTCTDANACGTTALKPKTTQSCAAAVTPPAPEPALAAPSTPEPAPPVATAEQARPEASQGIPLTWIFYGLAIVALVALGIYWYVTSRD